MDISVIFIKSSLDFYGMSTMKYMKNIIFFFLVMNSFLVLSNEKQCTNIDLDTNNSYLMQCPSDQGENGTCYAHAAANVMNHYLAKKGYSSEVDPSFLAYKYTKEEVSLFDNLSGGRGYKILRSAIKKSQKYCVNIKKSFNTLEMTTKINDTLAIKFFDQKFLIDGKENEYVTGKEILRNFVSHIRYGDTDFFKDILDSEISITDNEELAKNFYRYLKFMIGKKEFDCLIEEIKTEFLFLYTHQDGPGDEFKLRNNFSNSEIVSILVNGFKEEYKWHFNKYCDFQEISFPDYGYMTKWSSGKFALEIALDKNLDSNNLSAINLDSSVLKSSPKSEYESSNHSVVLAGRRWNKAKKQWNTPQCASQLEHSSGC